MKQQSNSSFKSMLTANQKMMPPDLFVTTNNIVKQSPNSLSYFQYVVYVFPFSARKFSVVLYQAYSMFLFNLYTHLVSIKQLKCRNGISEYKEIK